MSRLTIDQLKAVQRDRGLLDVHLVSFDNYGFTIAHTDAERTSGMDLHECPLHDWLGLEGPPDCGVGQFIARKHEADAYSEPYRSDPWDFDPLGDAQAPRPGTNTGSGT